MKKFLGVLLAVMVLTMAAFAADITVTLNGEVVDCESYGSPATIVEGRTLVPLRAIFEALGASVEWDQATRTVSSTLGEDYISLAVGSTTLIKNGEDVTLDVPAQIINDRTMVPARAIAEAYGVGVEWDAASRTVILTQEIPEEEPVEEEELAEGTFFVLTGENYTGSEGYKFTSGKTITPEVVADFDDENNKVLFIHSEYTDGQAWSYFRNETSVSYKVGERYLVKFIVSPELTSTDEAVDVASIGICFRYSDSEKEGAFVDHGVGTVKAEAGKWTEVYFIYTMPANFVENGSSGFGIFANPQGGLPVSYYLDDVSVSVYEGTASDGFQSADSMKAADEKENFNIDEAKGIVFDYDDSFDLTQVSSSDKYIEDGCLVMVAEGDFKDSQIYYRDLSCSAKDYTAIAVRFKSENAFTSGHPKAESFQVYFTTDSQDSLSESKSVTVPYTACIKDGDWYVAYIVMSGNENWTGTITMLRLDPAEDGGTFTVDKAVLLEA